MKLFQQTLSIYEIKTKVLEQLQPTHIITQDQCNVCAVNLPEVEKEIAKLKLIKIAGGKSLLSVKGKHSPYISWEDLVDVDPDVIVIMPCGFDLERTKQESKVLTRHPNWNGLKAVQNERVFIVDGNAYFNRPGPRLVDSAEILAEIFHPQLFNFGHRGKSCQQFL